MSTPRRPKRSRRERWMAALACLLALLMLLPMVMMALNSLTAVQAANTSQIQSQLDALKSKNRNISSQKSQLQGKLKELGEEKNKALDRKELLEGEIDLLQQEISNLDEQLAQYEALIQEKEREVAENEAKEQAQFELFCRQVRAMEEEGSVSYWGLLLSAQSLSDLLDRVNMVNDIADYNQEVCDQLQITRAALVQSKAELEQAKTDTEAARAQQVSAKSRLEAQEAEVQSLIKDIASNEQLTQQAIDDLEAAAKEMDAEIVKKERELQAAIEADRKAGGSKYNFDPGSGYAWPLPSSCVTITSFFGPRKDPFTGKKANHTGTDVSAPSGTEIRAAHGGVILTSKNAGSYGNYVVISRGDGITTLYAHMSKRAVQAGQTVSQGQLIGYVGSTGRSTGPHLHLEFRLNGVRQDALKYYPNLNWINRTGFSYK